MRRRRVRRARDSALCHWARPSGDACLLACWHGPTGALPATLRRASAICASVSDVSEVRDFWRHWPLARAEACGVALLTLNETLGTTAKPLQHGSTAARGAKSIRHGQVLAQLAQTTCGATFTTRASDASLRAPQASHRARSAVDVPLHHPSNGPSILSTTATSQGCMPECLSGPDPTRVARR